MSKSKPKGRTMAERRPEPHSSTKAAIDDATAWFNERTPRITVSVQRDANGAHVVDANHSDIPGHNAFLMRTFGSSSIEFATENLCSIMNVIAENGAVDQLKSNAALALVAGIEPANELEGAMAAQIAATHALSMRMLRKAGASDRNFLDTYINAATKLQRTMAAQVEALGKLRRGGEQVIRHVHINGGQNIVGQVTTGGPGDGNGKRQQAHARSISEQEMRGADALGGLLPGTSSVGPDKVPNARRKRG